MSQRRDELVLRPPIERRPCDDRDVDVAATVAVAAERARPGQVDADQLVAEPLAHALDELAEVVR